MPLEGTSSVRMKLLPLTPLQVTQPSASAKEHGYERGIAFFLPPNLQHSVLLLSSLCISQICGWSQCTAAFGEQQWEEAVESYHCTISSYFYKTSVIQSIALLTSHSSRQEHWNVHYVKPRRHPLAFIVTVEIFLYSKLLRRNIDSFIQNNDTQNCWITFPEHLSWRKISAAIPVVSNNWIMSGVYVSSGLEYASGRSQLCHGLSLPFLVEDSLPFWWKFPCTWQGGQN